MVVRNDSPERRAISYQDERKPLPPDVLAGALQDRICASSGRLLKSVPINHAIGKGRMTLCPICDIGRLTEHVEQMPAEWEGRSGFVPLRYSTCDTCLSEIVNAEQAAENKHAVLKFRQS